MATKTVFITTVGTGTFTVPNDFGSLVSVEAIGAGGDGQGASSAGGGGGGAYAKSTTMAGLYPGVITYYRVGTGGGTTTSGSGTVHSWFSLTNSNPTVNLSSGTTGVLAAGGNSTGGGSGGAGGTVANSTGDVRYAGGTGGVGTTSNSTRGGGGGAGGPGGQGGDGGAGASLNGSGGGGSGATLTAAGTIGDVGQTSIGGAGGASTGQTGGSGATSGLAANNTAPANGGGGGGGYITTNVNGGVGSAGTYWTQSSNNATAGSGGGGGGGSGGAGGGAGAVGGLYGGGGGGGISGSAGLGAQGIIVFTYIPVYGKKSGYAFPILNYDGSASDTIVDLDDMMVRKELFLDAGLFGFGASPIGDGTTVAKSSPVQIGLLTNWKQISRLSTTATFGVKTDGSLWAWGTNSSNGGPLGTGTTIAYSSPIQVGGLYNWKQITSSNVNAAAIKIDGTLWAWGYNINGAVGDGTTVDRSSPVQIGFSTIWKQVSTSVNHAFLALKTDGTLWGWGENNSGGRLGTGTTTNYSSPIQVGSLTTWKYIGGMSDASSAIKVDGTLWTWGQNAYGQLGDGTTASKSTPIQVGSLTNWKQLSTHGQYSVAIKNDGTLWSWGRNLNGNLGDGTTVDKSSPIQVGSLTNWKYVGSTNEYSTFCIKTDGSLWAWGSNTSGRLGTGTTTNYSSPIQVGSLTNWKQVIHGIGIQSPDLP